MGHLSPLKCLGQQFLKFRIAFLPAISLYLRIDRIFCAQYAMCGVQNFILIFDVLLTVQHLSIFILVVNQLDAQNFVLQ